MIGWSHASPVAARRADSGEPAAESRASHASSCRSACSAEACAADTRPTWTGLDDPRTPRAHLLHVQAADGAVLATQAADVTAAGAVQQKLPHRTSRERSALRRARSLRVQPRAGRAVGLLAACVALEQLAHGRRPLGIWHRNLRLSAPRCASGDKSCPCSSVDSRTYATARGDGSGGISLLAFFVGDEREPAREPPGPNARKPAENEQVALL